MDYYEEWLHACEVIEQLRRENEHLRLVNQRVEEQFEEASWRFTELEQRLYHMTHKRKRPPVGGGSRRPTTDPAGAPKPPIGGGGRVG